ncbi:unnamed protein product [Auanema sp. JU1783]|nr:unnamed protein product [Auanema sp. JU1783]
MRSSNNSASREEDPSVRRDRILRQNENFHRLVYEEWREPKREAYSNVKCETSEYPRLWELQDQRDSDPEYITKQCQSIAFIGLDSSLTKLDEIILHVIQKVSEERDAVLPFLTYNMYPFILNEDDYPIGLKIRQPGRLLRPVLVEGCSASFSLDSSYKPCFLHDLKMYDSTRKLCVRRLLQVVMHFTLRGHMVKVLLPTYYEEPYFKKLKQAPMVDDVAMYESLKNLGLIEFVTLEESSSAYIDKCKKMVDEIKACFVFRPDVDDQYARRFASAFLDRDTSQEETPIDPSTTPCSKRVVTANFMTVLDTLVFHDSFSTIIEENMEADGTNKTHLHINQRIILEYTEEAYELPMAEVREKHQLRFSDQVHLLLQLVQLTCFAPDIIRVVQLIMGLAVKGDVRKTEVEEFTKKYLI